MGRYIIGYVFDENGTQLGVKVHDTGEIVWVDWLEYDLINNKYVFDQICLNKPNAGDRYSLSLFWPI